MKSSFEQSFEEAARAAKRAVEETMRKYSKGLVTDEDDITGVLIGQLDSAFNNTIGGITWSSSILRHRKGIAAQEKEAGADMLFHVSITTPELSYSKGVLIQSKRVAKDTAMTANDHNELRSQCKKMTNITPASFVFNYMKSEMRCAAATGIAGINDRVLSTWCNLTAYQFFLGLFRCPIGDCKITSATFDELQIPLGISIKGTLG